MLSSFREKSLDSHFFAFRAEDAEMVLALKMETITSLAIYYFVMQH